MVLNYFIKIIIIYYLKATAGVPPELMGIGPAFAIPEVLKKTNLNTNDVDIYEINEGIIILLIWKCKWQ